MSKKIFIFGSYNPFQFEPETIDYLNALLIPDDSTVYYSGTAQEITGSGIWTAVNNFNIALKNAMSLTLGVNNLSTKFDAIHPFIGGTATTHKYNLVNPLDTNAAHRLTFSGGWTHSRTGALPNGTNTFANAYWDSSTKAGQKRHAFGWYSRTSNNTGTQLHGCWDLNNPTRIYNVISAQNFTFGFTVNNYARPTTRFHGVRVTSTVQEAYQDNVMRDSQTSANLTLTTVPFYWGARNNNNLGTSLYTLQEIALGFLTGSVEITNQQMLDINAAVDALQLALFRNV